MKALAFPSRLAAQEHLRRAGWVENADGSFSHGELIARMEQVTADAVRLVLQSRRIQAEIAEAMMTAAVLCEEAARALT